MNVPARRPEVCILPALATCSCRSCFTAVPTLWTFVHFVKKYLTFYRTPRQLVPLLSQMNPFLTRFPKLPLLFRVSPIQILCAFSYLPCMLHVASIKSSLILLRFEVFTAVNMKNGVFWDVTPCGSCKNRRFGGTYRLFQQGETKLLTRNNTRCMSP
jgi:hypothetical protein